MTEENPDYSRFTPRDKSDARSKRQAIITILFAVVTIGLAINFLWPESGTQQQVFASNKEKCAANLSRLHQAMAQYAGENNRKYPSRLEQLSLVVKDLPADVFACPGPPTGASKGSASKYIYAAAGMMHPPPANVVLIYEPLGNHLDDDAKTPSGANVLFANGKVSFVPTVTMEKMIRELRNGENPPPSGTGF